MLTQKGSKDFVVNTKRSIHPWGVPQTLITPTVVNKVLKVNTSGFVMSTQHSEPKRSRIELMQEKALKMTAVLLCGPVRPSTLNLKKAELKLGS
ncbi:hypothetical protein DPMN_002217 [Dreissena polymorpha]|uniref:Uncharacterized protein n=1 Tax=Dreissena polymorpha TaxID=45954 RepID=A0A9D4MLV0_DREPO|nr:hypothetical protein DPMN_002217 [Dreissena polymorpha]